MASHRRAAPNPTILILAMVASALLLAMGIWAAIVSSIPSAGPVFQPPLPAAGPPPSPGDLTPWIVQPEVDTIILTRATPVSPAPRPASAAQKSAPAPVPNTAGIPKISAPSANLSESIQKRVTRHNVPKTSPAPAPEPEVVPAPVPGGVCSGTASQCLDGIQAAPLATDLGTTLDGLLCLKLMNSGCL
jgi:hypothetical protein